jgi:hypothetical protein
VLKYSYVKKKVEEEWGTEGDWHGPMRLSCEKVRKGGKCERKIRKKLSHFRN